MRSQEFRQGVADVREGKRPQFDKGDWQLLLYEQGRLWGTIAPRSMLLTVNGKPNPAAVDLWEREREAITP